MLGEALTAVNRPALCRLEGDLGLLPAIRADDLGHLTRAAVGSTAPISITQYFHSYSVCMLRTPRGILRTLGTQAPFSLLNPFTQSQIETGKTNRVASDEGGLLQSEELRRLCEMAGKVSVSR